MTASHASSEDCEDLPSLEVGLAQALATKIQHIVASAAQSPPGRQASPEAKKLVARRVPNSCLSNYQVMDGYGFVVWDETMSILDRILVYPFIASYRKHLKDAPAELFKAWQFHSHSLQVGELYIILDRTLALLEFLAVVGKDCGLVVTDHRKSFEKTFKKTFERRLRERHRLTHAHERPSLVSRFIDLAGGKWAGDDNAIIKQLNESMNELLPMLAKASEAVGRTPPQTLEEIEALHEWNAQQDAKRMLKIVGEALLGTINKLPFC